MAQFYPNVRLFTVNHYESNTPIENLADENIRQRWDIPSVGRYSSKTLFFLFQCVQNEGGIQWNSIHGYFSNLQHG